MSSSRLPGKVMLPLAGAPMLIRQCERVARSKRIDRLVVATSDEASDDPLAEAAARYGLNVYRGSLDNVQARFIGALEAFGPADHVVRLTGDCPLIDPALIDTCIDEHLRARADYTTNTPADAAFAKGLDVEVMTAPALRRAAAMATSSEEREHVTWIFHTRPDLWRDAAVRPPVDESEVRWTVDRPDDYAFVRQVFDTLLPANPAFTSDDVRAFVRGRADLAAWGGDRRL